VTTYHDPAARVGAAVAELYTPVVVANVFGTVTHSKTGTSKSAFHPPTAPSMMRQRCTSVFSQWRLILTRQSIWLASLAGSILTTKALMMGAMMDSPLYLLLAQVGVTASAALIQTVCPNQSIDGGAPGSPSRTSAWTMAWSLILLFTDSACLIVGYKVLRYSGSLPAAVMILSLPGGHILRRLTDLSFLEGALRCFCFLCGFALVLLWDFRLNVTSRDMSIAWLALSTAVGVISGRCLPGFLRPENVPERLRIWPAYVLLPVGLVAYLDEGLQGLHRVSGPQGACLLPLNLSLTSTAWLLKDALAPVMRSGSGGNSVQTAKHRQTWPGGCSWICLLGLISLGSWLIPGYPVFVSFVQCLGYVVAMLACTGRNEVTSASARSTPWAAVDDRENCSDEAQCLQDDVEAAEKETTELTDCSDLSHGGRLDQRLSLFAAATVWILFALSRLAPGPEGDTLLSVRINQGHSYPADLDIVIAAYDRPATETMRDLNALLELPPLQESTSRVFLYDKGAQAIGPYENIHESLSNKTELRIIQLENMGKEGETYLHHITTHWDDLGRHSLFVQEHAHDFDWMKQRIADYFIEDTGFMSLSYQGKLWNQCRDVRSKSWPGFARAVARTLRMVRPDTACRDLILTFRGQFLASAARIRGNNKSLYEQLLGGLLGMSSWMHQPEYIEKGLTAGNTDSLIDPAFGYVLERLWGEIMGCSSARIAHRSPSLLSSYVRSVWFGQKFPREDVQCLDHPV